MCVTSSPALISDTRTAICRTETVDICLYQNKSRPFGPRYGPNCMFLNFAGKNLDVVRGPERTYNLMEDMTRGLPELQERFAMRGGTSRSAASFNVQVMDYGDYTVVLAQGPSDILDALNQVPADRRPQRTPQLEAFINFYMSFYPDHSFVLACFNSAVEPRHPIAVRYVPNDADVLTIPGLDGHDGQLPTIGAPVHRDFHVAYAVSGYDLPHKVSYRDDVGSASWAPNSLVGFRDNRDVGPNGDYVVPLTAVLEGLSGRDLAATLK